MLVSPLASSTSPATYFIGHEPSGRWPDSTQAKARSAAPCSPATVRAIAASRWFQTSACPPTVHGMAPSGSCAATIEAAEAATCPEVSTACGSRGPGSCR